MSSQPPQDSIPSHESLPPQAMPRVEYDPNLEGMATVEIDAQFFGQLMTSHGVSDEEIASTTIFASADVIIEGQGVEERDNTIVQFGESNPKTKTVTVSIGSIGELMKYAIETQDPASPLDEEDLVELASLQATESLSHEVGHRIDRALGLISGADNRAYYAEKLPEKRLGKILRAWLRKSDDPAHHQLADLHRQREVAKMIFKGNKTVLEDYQEDPREKFADSVADEALELLDDTDTYPVKVTFTNLLGSSTK